MCDARDEKREPVFGSLFTYDKRYKALNVPDKPHSVVVVLAVVVDVASVEVHAPTVVATVL